jgi:hypothetical protein
MLRTIPEDEKKAVESKFRNLIGEVVTSRGSGFESSALRACIVAEDFSNGVNEINFDHETCGKAMTCDHRTLIQTKMRVFIEFARELAKDYDAGHYDLRNEDACKAAKAMVDSLEPAGIYALRSI